MPGRPFQPRDGQHVKDPPEGFPLYFDKRMPRIVTADPWAFLDHLADVWLSTELRSLASAYIQQGYEFFESASSPNFHSRPLLYYYSFLNLVKAGLLIEQVNLPPTAKHGIHDPKANIRQRLRFEGQRVGVPGSAADHSEIFPELLSFLDAGHLFNRRIKVIDLLRQIPGVHRTFTSIMGESPNFTPISRFEFYHRSGEVWFRCVLEKLDKDVSTTLSKISKKKAFTSLLKRVAAGSSTDIVFESRVEKGNRRAMDTALSRLACGCEDIGVASLLKIDGYTFYFNLSKPIDLVPDLAATYATMFYLGSITRYKPDVFGKIVAGKYAWLVEEFLATQPYQFIYKLCSRLAGTSVVRPQALTLIASHA